MADARHNNNNGGQTISESTPLLGESSAQGNGSYGSHPPRRLSTASTTEELSSSTTAKSKRRWASITALGLLCIFMVLIMLLGFFVPQSLQEYAAQAVTLDVQAITPEFQDDGLRARVRGTFALRSDRVHNVHVRNLGVFGTWIAREAETVGENEVEVRLPEYDNVLLGTAILPPIKVSLLDGRETIFDFITNVRPDTAAIGRAKEVVDKWMKGQLDHLQLKGTTEIKLRSGIIKLPGSAISEFFTVENSKIPAMPKFNITKLNVHDRNGTDAPDGIQVDAEIAIQNDFAIDLDIPSLGFKLMVNNCLPEESKITLAEAVLEHSVIRARQDVVVKATGYVHPPSDDLIDICPSSGKSPLDTLLGGYIRGNTITVFIRGSDIQPEGTPPWLRDVLGGIVVPVPFTGHSFGNVIKNFTMEDMAFSLPDSDSGLDSPQISANIKAVITLPEEMNFSVDVKRVRATADVFHKKTKVGELDLKKWQPASSSPLSGGPGEPPMLLVESEVEKAPLHITDDDAFTDILQKLLFGQTVTLKIKALVDVEINTALGVLTIQEIPAEGDVPVKPILGGTHDIADSLKPVIRALDIFETTAETMKIKANVDVTNPTNYSATIPYANVHILVNDTILGHATINDLEVIPGVNGNLSAVAEWRPIGKHGAAVGRELLSQYISGWNISLGIRLHKNSIPGLPSLGEALSKINITIPVPHLRSPDDDDDPDDDDGDDDPETPRPRFLKGATMHLLSSSATFILSSPLTTTSIHLTSLNATSFYKDDPVGTIFIPDLDPDDPAYYEIDVPPGDSETDRLPVDWNLGSVGYDAVRRALGGSLKLRAEATAGVRIGEWREKVWIVGGGIGAGVKL